MRFHHHPGARRTQHTAGSTRGPGCRPWQAVADRPGRQWPHSARSGPGEGSVSWSPGSSRIRCGGGGGGDGLHRQDRTRMTGHRLPATRERERAARPTASPGCVRVVYPPVLARPGGGPDGEIEEFLWLLIPIALDLPVGQVIFGRLHPTRHICKIRMSFRPIGLPGQPFGGAMTT